MMNLQQIQRSLRRHLLIGLLATAIMVIGIGGWAMTTELAGAIIAQGSLVVDSNVKKVQHPTGGIVGELHVRDGDSVKTGDLLVRLDATVARSNLGAIVKSLAELYARQARLEAEREGNDKIEVPPELAGRLDDPDYARPMAGERKLFELRVKARDGQQAQLRERIVQLQEEIRGLIEQADAKEQEIKLIKRELEGVQELFRKNLIQITRLTALERDAARLEGERGRLIAQIASSRGKIAETELQVIQVEQNRQSEVGKEIAEVRAKISELTERRVTAEDQLRRIDLVSPQDGFVHQLAVHTVGGVINAGEAVMLIVPAADRLTVEVKASPQDIDQLQIGQAAVLRFSSFSVGTTPEINGEVSRVSADTSQDQRTGALYYTVRITVTPEELRRLGSVKLVPGMPVEAFIQTGERTVLSYLVKPLSDQVMRAFRGR
jgi:membrane fusion protein, type I secretion system